MEIILFLISFVFSIAIAIRSVVLKRRADFVADSNKLFYAVQKEKLDEEKRSLHNEKIAAEKHIQSKAKEQSQQIQKVANSNEVTLYEIKETAMLLADHHNRFEKMVNNFTSVRTLDHDQLNQLLVESAYYRGTIEKRFFSWFGRTIDEYKKAKIELN